MMLAGKYTETDGRRRIGQSDGIVSGNGGELTDMARGKCLSVSE